MFPSYFFNLFHFLSRPELFFHPFSFFRFPLSSFFAFLPSFYFNYFPVLYFYFVLCISFHSFLSLFITFSLLPYFSPILLSLSSILKPLAVIRMAVQKTDCHFVSIKTRHRTLSRGMWIHITSSQHISVKIPFNITLISKWLWHSLGVTQTSVMTAGPLAKTRTGSQWELLPL